LDSDAASGWASPDIFTLMTATGKLRPLGIALLKAGATARLLGRCSGKRRWSGADLVNVLAEARLQANP